jgi:hypothetical protein
MNTLSERQMPPEEVYGVDIDMFGIPFAGIHSFNRAPVQQEGSSRRITTSQTAQQVVNPKRPNFIRQKTPLQTITIPPQNPLQTITIP